MTFSIRTALRLAKTNRYRIEGAYNRDMNDTLLTNLLLCAGLGGDMIILGGGSVGGKGLGFIQQIGYTP